MFNLLLQLAKTKKTSIFLKLKSSRRVHYFFHLTSFESRLDPGDDSPKYVKNCLFQKIPLKQQKSRCIKACNLLKRLKTVQNSLKVCQLLEFRY